MDEKTMIEGCIQKDHAAWSIFVRTYQSLILRSVRYEISSLNLNCTNEEAHDIAQEVLVAIWEGEKLSMLRDVRCLKSWLIMLSINKTINYSKSRNFRAVSKEVSYDIKIPCGDENLTLGDVLACDKFNGERIAEEKEESQMFEREIQKLAGKEQLAIRLNIFHGKKYKEIARIMNLPINTVSTLIKRAKEKIREGAECRPGGGRGYA
jgi:RNA polymerase sigma-70 factor (ECF subfamily)